MRYEGNIYRPFSEANSYLLQCTIGCSHNQCTFCGMYKDRKFRIRTLDEIKTDIHMAKEYYGDVEKVFLCDGDAIAIETDILLEKLQELRNRDREEPRDSPPPTPPGIRITYHGGSVD